MMMMMWDNFQKGERIMMIMRMISIKIMWRVEKKRGIEGMEESSMETIKKIISRVKRD